MSNIVRLKILNEGIQLGALSEICFGCGAETNRLVSVFYEEDKMMTIIHRIKSFMTRTEFKIPLCKKCSFARFKIKITIFFWVIIFFLSITIGILLIEYFDKWDDLWVRFFALMLTIFPFFQIKKNWMKKDRGSNFIELKDLYDTEAVIRIINSEAFEKIKKIEQW